MNGESLEGNPTTNGFDKNLKKDLKNLKKVLDKSLKL